MNLDNGTIGGDQAQILERYQELWKQYELEHGPQSEEARRDTLQTWINADKEKVWDAEAQGTTDDQENDRREDIVYEQRENQLDRGGKA